MTHVCVIDSEWVLRKCSKTLIVHGQASEPKKFIDVLVKYFMILIHILLWILCRSFMHPC